MRNPARATQLSAMAGALLFGVFEHKLGARPTLFTVIAMLMAATFGVVADVFSRQSALLMVVGFFIIGALLLSRVPLRQGLADAQAEDDV